MIVKTRFPSTDKILRFSDLISCKWRANNVDGFLENKNCFKIHCVDVEDDIIDIFASHITAVSRNFCQIDYSTLEWKYLYDSLNFIFDMEKELYEWSLNNGSNSIQKDILNNIYSSIDEAESQLNLKLTESV